MSFAQKHLPAETRLERNHHGISVGLLYRLLRHILCYRHLGASLQQNHTFERGTAVVDGYLYRGVPGQVDRVILCDGVCMVSGAGSQPSRAHEELKRRLAGRAHHEIVDPAARRAHHSYVQRAPRWVHLARRDRVDGCRRFDTLHHCRGHTG